MPISDTSAIERVARILAGLRASANADGDQPSASGQVDSTWRDSTGDAIALLKTLREPSAAMAAAGNAEIWTAMVHAALRETQSSPTGSTSDTHPAGQEAAPHPGLDPTRKTLATTDPTAQDPGNGAD